MNWTYQKNLLIAFILFFILSAVIIGKTYLVASERNQQYNSPNCPYYLSHLKACLQIKWLNDVIQVGEPFAILIELIPDNKQLYDQEYQLIDAKLIMPDMGHGAAPISIHRNNNRIWILSRLTFNMDGYWEILINFGEKIELSVDQISIPLKCSYKNGCEIIK